MTTAEILRQAKALITRESWVNHSPNEELGQVCAVLAIGLVFRPLNPLLPYGLDAGNDFRNARTTLTRAIGEEVDLGGYPLINWNDAPGRTIEEIWAGFDAAIGLAEVAA